MVSAMDEAIGNIIQTLKDAKKMHDTVILFTSDVN